jgi:hypothetical protein
MASGRPEAVIRDRFTIYIFSRIIMYTVTGIKGINEGMIHYIVLDIPLFLPIVFPK